MSALSKQINACKTAIELFKKERRARYAAGEYAYRQGIREQEINDEGITGTAFAFANDGHKGYVHLTECIKEMEDMIESLQDAEVIISTHQLPMFEEVE